MQSIHKSSCDWFGLLTEKQKFRNRFFSEPSFRTLLDGRLNYKFLPKCVTNFKTRKLAVASFASRLSFVCRSFFFFFEEKLILDIPLLFCNFFVFKIAWLRVGWAIAPSATSWLCPWQQPVFDEAGNLYRKHYQKLVTNLVQSSTGIAEAEIRLVM